MKAKLILAGILCALAGVASASEPVALSETQMDSVTAGGLAQATAAALANGVITAATLTAVATSTTINRQAFIGTEAGGLNLILSQSASTSNATAQ